MSFVSAAKSTFSRANLPKGYIVVIAFDSAEKTREWYDSPGYAAIRPIKQSSTKSRLFIAEGVAPE
jgi:uncharacterized protein (DUF1330 family)